MISNLSTFALFAINSCSCNKVSYIHVRHDMPLELVPHCSFIEHGSCKMTCQLPSPRPYSWAYKLQFFLNLISSEIRNSASSLLRKIWVNLREILARSLIWDYLWFLILLLSDCFYVAIILSTLKTVLVFLNMLAWYRWVNVIFRQG